MEPSTITNAQAKEMLDAQAHICNHTLGFQNSMALKCAIQLGISDVIQKYGKPIPLSELANALNIHPIKTHSLYRLMRFLCNSNFFSTTKLPNKEVEFDLTMSSRLLLKDHPLTQAPFVLGVLDKVMIDSSHHFASWFKNDKGSPFEIAHGRTIWEYANLFTDFNESFNQSMASDAQFVTAMLVANNESKGIFEGLKSLVDVGGGDGTFAKAIVKAYPQLKCIVLDLPHVVKGLQDDEQDLVYMGGDMFEAIPSANAILFKWIFHDWSDEKCIKILQRSKEAIPSKDLGGKVIIIDMVLLENQNEIVEHSETQILCDMQMMSLTTGGKERTEDEWKKLFINAGFNDYKIFSVLGVRSVIEVYP